MDMVLGEKCPLHSNGQEDKAVLHHLSNYVDSSNLLCKVLLLLLELCYCKNLHHCNLDTRVLHEDLFLGCKNQLDMQLDHQLLQGNNVLQGRCLLCLQG